jgi:hypothetical protein
MLVSVEKNSMWNIIMRNCKTTHIYKSYRLIDTSNIWSTIDRVPLGVKTVTEIPDRPSFVSEKYEKQ